MLTLMLAGALVVCGVMLLLWLIHFPLRNAAIVDAGWAGGLAMLGALYAVMGTGWAPRRFAIASMALFWGLRLALYLLFTRVIGHPEEGRYVELRKQWRTNIPLKFLLFFEFQAVLCIVLATPFLLASQNPAPEFSVFEYAAGILWVVAIAGEITADMQLNAFKSNAANRGKTCRAGSVEILAPSQLLLRVAHLGCLLPVRNRFQIRLSGARPARAHAVLSFPSHRHPGH